ncbi:MAG: type II toxin-antitoxin system VapC family toxin [Chlorobi bacterium]|nr:type II toxin-antitoxin system VapC family toxin [Chlorobiota bacterium]
MDVLLDTNVLFYFFDKSSKYHNLSSEIIENLDNRLFVSIKNISEFISVSSKIGISQKQVIDFISEVIHFCTILYGNDTSLAKFLQLIEKYKVKGNRVYDIEIVSIMLTNNINTIATFNTKDFKEITEINILPVCL